MNDIVHSSQNNISLSLRIPASTYITVKEYANKNNLSVNKALTKLIQEGLKPSTSKPTQPTQPTYYDLNPSAKPTADKSDPNCYYDPGAPDEGLEPFWVVYQTELPSLLTAAPINGPEGGYWLQGPDDYAIPVYSAWETREALSAWLDTIRE